MTIPAPASPGFPKQHPSVYSTHPPSGISTSALNAPSPSITYSRLSTISPNFLFHSSIDIILIIDSYGVSSHVLLKFHSRPLLSYQFVSTVISSVHPLLLLSTMFRRFSYGCQHIQSIPPGNTTITTLNTFPLPSSNLISVSFNSLRNLLAGAVRFLNYVSYFPFQLSI